MKTLTLPRLSLRKLIALIAVAALPIAASRAADIYWTNGTASYNNAAHWSSATIPGTADNAHNTNGLGNVVQINAGNPDWTVIDIKAGGTNTAGAFEQNGQTVNVTGWLITGAGIDAIGTYTLNSGTLNVAGGRIFLGDHPGSTSTLNINGGTINKSGDVFVVADGGWNGAGGRTGTVNQVAGTVNSTSEVWIGQTAQGVGIYNLSGGSINSSNWFVVGRAGSQGTMNMTGGSILHVTGGGTPAFIVADGAAGTLNHSAGTITTTAGEYWVGNGGAAIGTNNLSGSAAVTVSNWIAFGRSGLGVLNMSGGSMTKFGNGHVTLGAFGGSFGLVNQTGGGFTNTTSQTWIGETTAGQWDMNGGVAALGFVDLARGGGSSGVLNLNGGTFLASEITSSTSGGTLNFNGGTLVATANNPNFLHDLSGANVLAGGAIIDSAGFNITISQTLSDSGSLTKLGAGTLTLSGANSYAGGNIVNGGKLVTTTASTSGDITVGNSASFGLVVLLANAQMAVPNVTLGTSSLDFDLGAFGNPTTAPLSASSTLAVNGAVTVNIADALPQVGQFPLIQFATRTGSGSFVLGTIPVGVVASIVTNIPNSTIDLNITSVNLPRWDGQAGGNWDIGLTTNWINIGTGLPTFYGEGNFVLFDDNALGTTTVNLAQTVNPGSVTVNNNTLPYTLVGSGRISGPTSFTKQGPGNFTIANTGGNNYTGKTIVSGGTLTVTSLANGGVASSIGASSSSPTNLVLSGGTLSYAGPAGVSINRGFSLATTSTNGVNVQSNLTVSGQVTAANLSSLIKSGPATLTYTTVGTNTHAGSSSALGYRIEEGSVVFDGSSGAQTNFITGGLRIAPAAGTNASVIVTNATVSILSSSFNVGQGAGSTGTLALAVGTITQTSSPYSLGNGGGFGYVQQSGGAITTSGELWVGNTAGAGQYDFSGGTLGVGNWVAIGRFGATGIFNMTGGTFTKTGGGEFLVAAGNNSVGTLNHSGGLITINNQFLVPENGNTNTLGTYNISGTAEMRVSSWIAIGRGSAAGVLNISGGTLAKVAGGGSSFIIAANGPGTVTQTGGTLSNTISQTWISENSPATWTMSAGTGVFGFLQFARNGSGVGTLNQNGGVISANEIAGGAGLATNNYNGATIRARTSIANFLHDLDEANILAGGLIVDTDTNTIGASQVLAGAGGLTKNGTGTLRLNGVNTYAGTTLVNAGTLGGMGTIAGPVSIAAGASLAPGLSIGTLTVNNTLTLAGTSVSQFEVTMVGGATNDIVTGLTSISYGGSLVVTNVGASPLVAGTIFKLFNVAGPISGNFSSVTILPAGTGTFNPATGELTITSSGILLVNAPARSGGNLVLTGTGGTPGGSYSWLTATNVATPNWTTNGVGTFDGTGGFSNAFPVNASEPARFFRIQTP